MGAWSPVISVEAGANFPGGDSAEEAALAEDRKRRGLLRPNVEQILRRAHHDDRPANPKRGRKPLCFASTFPVADAFRKTWRAWVAGYHAASEAFRAGGST